MGQRIGRRHTDNIQLRCICHLTSYSAEEIHVATLSGAEPLKQIGTHSINCEYLSELSHPNELHFIVVGCCEAENVHISQKITLDTVSASSFIGNRTAPESVAWWQSSVLALLFSVLGETC